MQLTDFEIEILINDDHSTDGTTEIIKKYQKKYPEIIKPVFHTENMYKKGVRGMMAKYLLPKVRGKYIALCEGDDYWTDKNKLQKQVEFLEKNSGYSMCFHPVEIVGGANSGLVFPDRKNDFNLERLLESNFIQTNSVVYRKQSYKELHDGVMPGDWYLHLYHARFGKIGFINDTMAAYRHHEGGLWSSSRTDERKFWTSFGVEHLEFYLHVYDLFKNNDIYKSIITTNIWNTISKILDFDKNSTQTVTNFFEKHPELMLGVLGSAKDQNDDLAKSMSERDSHIHQLNLVIESKERQIADIKASRVWKIRNTIARLLGKKAL